MFTVAVGALLIGLTNKQTADWAVFEVGGLILIGLALGAVFVFIESRAKEPIVPLDLWKDRTYSASIIATFLISFGFFGAAVFLPLWFQFVYGATPTMSGLYSLALLAGLIISSIGSGQLVARTGRYKAVILAGLAVMSVGLFLVSHIQADTPLPVLWGWMFITGLGIGPTMAVFTIVVQNAVPVRVLGVATSNLTFFRQMGGVVGLSILYTVFGTRLTSEVAAQLAPLAPKLVAAGVPPEALKSLGGGQATSLVEVGKPLGETILAAIPEPVRTTVTPFINDVVNGIHQAFSVAIGEVFLIGAGTTLVALAVSFAMRELPLRGAIGAKAASGAVGAEAALGAEVFDEVADDVIPGIEPAFD